jgi:hypothetical protein
MGIRSSAKKCNTEMKSQQKWAWVLRFRPKNPLLYPMYPISLFLLFRKMLRKVQIREERVVGAKGFEPSTSWSRTNG